MEESIDNNKCRFFIQDIENKSWQLFSLKQNKRDGSIYLTSPEFTSFEWMTIEIHEGGLKTLKLEQDKDGHLSFHGHGQVHIKSKDEKYKLALEGQYLLRPEKTAGGNKRRHSRGREKN